MAGTLIVDRIESASITSSVNVATQVTFSNNVAFTGSTSGTTTVKAAAVAGTNILTLPAVTGTLGAYSQIYSVTASAASSALTVTLNPCVLDFRDSSLTSGTVNTRTVSAAISMVVSSGSTLGTVSATQSRIVVLALDNAGTIELAVVNISGGAILDETTLISTTAEGGAGAADSATVVYSTTARTSLPFRVVGFIQSTQATAGTWATAPSTIQGVGGQASTSLAMNASGLAAMFAARAWVNFNGTGTVAIRGSGNVTSITDNGTGDYTVNFTTAMPDANYVANVTGDVGGAGDFAVGCTRDATARTTSLVRISVGTTAGASADSNVVAVSVFR